MAHRHSKNKWKEFYITSHDELGWLESAWQSSYAAFGKGKVFEIHKNIGMVRTNLSVRDCRALFRHACVPWYDYVTGIEPEEAEAV